MRVAVIGSGISGLSAAWWLSRKHEVHLFEKANRLGGHTHSHSIDTSAGPKQIDTGFIVHNDRTYPNLIRLFATLGLETQNSEMSWGVTGRRGTIEYASNGLAGFFATPTRIFSPEHWRLLTDILRFNREALQLLNDGRSEDTTLGAFLEAQRYSTVFRDFYLYPTVAAIWSTAPARVLEFPAATLIRFFNNHGLLSVNRHPQWKVLTGGSSVYIDKLIQPLGCNVYLGKAVVSVQKNSEGVQVRRDGEDALHFDAVVIAAHGPQALAMIDTPTPQEREILDAFRVSDNEAVLHTDTSILPKRQAAWASWNYRVAEEPGALATLTYDMNRLQNLGTRERYLVTLNSTDRLDPKTILRRMNYEHPLFTRDAVRAQCRWSEISGASGIHFCGAYWRNGFHEDGYWSALRVARALGVECEIL